MKIKVIASYIVVILIVLIGLLAVVFWPKTSTAEEIILFVSDTCPHCKNVEKFLDENKVAEKVQFEIKEVNNNESNLNKLASKSAICGIKSDEIGVPLLWDSQTCIVGEPDIINFFKNKAGIQ